MILIHNVSQEELDKVFRLIPTTYVGIAKTNDKFVRKDADKKEFFNNMVSGELFSVKVKNLVAKESQKPYKLLEFHLTDGNENVVLSMLLSQGTSILNQLFSIEETLQEPIAIYITGRQAKNGQIYPNFALVYKNDQPRWKFNFDELPKNNEEREEMILKELGKFSTKIDYNGVKIEEKPATFTEEKESVNLDEIDLNDIPV